LYTDLLEKGRAPEAIRALQEAARCNPGDREARAILAKAAVAEGNLEAARGYLDRETAGKDPALLLALVDIELRSGQLEQAGEILPQLFAIDPGKRDAIVELAWVLSESNPAAAFVCIDAAVDALVPASEFDDAASILQEFVTRIPTHVPALLRLVEICVDGGLEAAMYEAQAQLADAYLSSSQAAEARFIAEDLVAREPWESAHIERFRRALVMLRVPEPDTVIAERLSGQTPFTATDHFSDPVRDEPPPPPPIETAVPEPTPEPIAPVHAAPAPAVVPSPPKKSKPRGPVEIDLTSALGDLQEPASAPPLAPKPAEGNLDDVFKGLRKDASRKGTPDQSAQHMKLARTYLEMGMMDEATAALKIAARSPRQRFEAGSLLGRMFKEHGDIPQAIEWLERAAEAPPPTAEEGQALLYDLGVTLEESGETARALAVFLELQADAGDYRDVPQRADRLARVQTGG
jgi:tetratricopeptide (TPR) repeat protein